MTAALLRLPLVAAALLATGGLTPAADPLPRGATARLGSTRMRDSTGWAGAALSPDGKFLVVGRPDGFARVEVATGDPAGGIGPKSGGGYGGRIELTPDGTRALTVGYSAAQVWEVASGKRLAEVKRPIPYGDGAAALSADGKVLALGGARNFNEKDKPITALVWDVEKNAKRAEVTVLQNQTAGVALSPDGKVLATWGTHYDQNTLKEGGDPATDPNRVVQFWDAATGKELARVPAGQYGQARVTFSPDGQTAAVSQGTGAIRLIDPRTGAEKRRVFGRGDQGVRTAFSPDGKTLASAGTDGTVQLFGVADGARGPVVECPIGPLTTGVRQVTFTAADRAVAWTAVGQTAVVWEVPSGKLLSPLAGHVAGVRSVAFAADGKEILSSGDDGLVLRWDATGKELGEVRLRGTSTFGAAARYPLGSVQLTADGRTAVGQTTQSGIYDAVTGRQVAAPFGAFGFDTRTVLCPDARTLLAVPGIPFNAKKSPNSLKVGVWDVATGAKVADIEVPAGDVAAAAVSPDRSKLVTVLTTRAAGGGRGEFQVAGWELATGKKLGTYTEPGGFNTPFLAMSPDNATALVTTPGEKLAVITLADGKVAREIGEGRVRITAAPVFAPGGKQVAVAVAPAGGVRSEAAVQVYDWASGKLAATFRGHVGAITCLAFSADGKRLATGGADTTVLLWDVAAAKE